MVTSYIFEHSNSLNDCGHLNPELFVLSSRQKLLVTTFMIMITYKMPNVERTVKHCRSYYTLLNSKYFIPTAIGVQNEMNNN